MRVVEYALDVPAGPGRERYRLRTSLLDPRAFPATTSHERWEAGPALAEVKAHLWAHPRPLRSERPRGVVQEVYGRLLAHLAHLAIRTRMPRAARRDRVDPDRPSVTGARRGLRRAVPRAQRTAPTRFPHFAGAGGPTSPPSAFRPAAPAPTRAPSSAR